MGCVNLIGSGLLSPLGMYPRHTLVVDGGSSLAVDRPGGGTVRHPLKTIRYAVAIALADTLVLALPGHTETIDQDNWTWNAEGIWVRGLGPGGRRPTLTFTTSVDATLQINRSNSVLENLLFVNDVNGLTYGIQGARQDAESTTITGVCLYDIEYRDLADKETATPIILLSNAYVVDGLRIIGNVGQSLGTRGLVGNRGTDVLIRNFHIDGYYPQGPIRNVVGPELNKVIDGGEGSYIWQRSSEDCDLAIDVDTACTGSINGPIRIRLATDTNNIDECIREHGDPGPDMQFYNKGANIISVVNADGESGCPWPGTPSVDE